MARCNALHSSKTGTENTNARGMDPHVEGTVSVAQYTGYWSCMYFCMGNLQIELPPVKAVREQDQPPFPYSIFHPAPR